MTTISLKSILILCLLALTPGVTWGQNPPEETEGGAPADAKSAAVKPPVAANFDIVSFASTYLSNWRMRDGSNVKCFKVGFKILTDEGTFPQSLRIYLFNDKKELVETLGYMSTQARDMQGIPNLVTSFDNLRK